MINEPKKKKQYISIWDLKQIFHLYDQQYTSQRKPHPILFSSHEDISIYVRHVISLFHKKWQKLRRRKLHNEYRIPHSFSMVLCRCIYKNWMEGTYDMPNNNSYLFVITEPNRMGVNLQFWKLLMLKVRCFFKGRGAIIDINLIIKRISPPPPPNMLLNFEQMW